MLDFLYISTRYNKKRGLVEIYPKFIIKHSQDLMIRGSDFYAIWLDDVGLWSTDEQDAINTIDGQLDIYAKQYKEKLNHESVVLHLWDAETGMIDSWHKYCQKQMRDSFHMLDEKLIFSNTETNKKDYASKKLDYALEPCDIPNWDKLISTLYSEEERHKIEWAIGSIVSGDSKKIQKFMVLYGAAGTGKSTILNIIQQLFAGYYSVFDAKALGSSSNTFALEAFKTNPLVAIQHDGDLSRIEDNTRLNSLVSHEIMTVNEKFKSTYSNRFKCFLFVGTNKPVKITDAKSGLIRRLIDVTPSGEKLSASEYKKTFRNIKFELGGIADHCLHVYLDNPTAYDNYVPKTMLGATNDFYNFIAESYFDLVKEEGITLKAAWDMYKDYCTDARVMYPLVQRTFKEELKNYYEEYRDRYTLTDGTRVRSYYLTFKKDMIDHENDIHDTVKEPEVDMSKLISFDTSKSIFDKVCADCPAQYANANGTPKYKWENVTTKLKDLDTTKLHYVKVPDNHIVIDFDIKDEHGRKDFKKNLIEASKWPATYGELSKSGGGIHLHYFYVGDPSKLSHIYDDEIEIKVFTGNSSLRRKLSKCVNHDISTINSGLPLKGEKKVINFDGMINERGIRTLIKRNLSKEYHAGTKPSIDFIYKILEDAYNNGVKYDVSDMYNPIVAFAINSTHHSDYCISMVDKMHFHSEEPSEPVKNDTDELVFFDIECYPNLFHISWKPQSAKKCIHMVNPSSEEVEELIKRKLVGFNCRGYDNHMLYARIMGYSNEQLFNLSQRIVTEGIRNVGFGEAYNISEADVYDFASAAHKQSLKKWEIELGIHHQEMDIPWEEPVPEDLWPKVAEYCDNDVFATEAVFNHLQPDFIARTVLSNLTGRTVNDTTNSLTTKLIFGNDKHPQKEFQYRNLAEPVRKLPKDVSDFLTRVKPKMMNKSIDITDTTYHEYYGEDSLLPYFPGYKFEFGKSTYRGEEVGEGGYVYAEPGIYGKVSLCDITSQHPNSTIDECLFGAKYTKRFEELVNSRIAIKHEDWATAETLLDGKLKPYIKEIKNGTIKSKDLATALKTAINSVYGLTAAHFDNPFKDSRNVDNIVAKRGALFMINLKHEVQARGFTVVHIKTDSIKIADATPEIIKFVMDYGEKYGYSFEHEATYEKMCIVNNAVYIAKFATEKECKKLYGYAPDENIEQGGQWTATGTQFQVPYVFKTLFSKEPIEFQDLCETKQVKSKMYLDFDEGLPEGEHSYKFVGKVGSFCPIKPGKGGGVLYRVKDGKYNAVTGTKGYRWMEAEVVKDLKNKDIIDKSYHNALVNDAIDTISKYGNFDDFINYEVADEPDEPNLIISSDELPEEFK